MNTSGIPDELRNIDQWLLWRYQQRPGQAKPTKVPYRALDPHRKASTTDPTSWARYEDAIASAATADGIGFVFTPDDPYCGIDLDGFDQPEQMHIVRMFDSYTERSVSGGLHIILAGRLPGNGRHPADFGVFDRGRYFVVTGDRIDEAPAEIGNRQPELEEFLEIYLPPLPTPTPPAPAQPSALDDRELLERAFASRTGHDFQRLYNGDTTDFSSASEADLALCRTAAFWTGRDPGRIDTWMRSSGLMRDKWERPDYRERTIELAIATTNDVYTPPAQPRAPPSPNGNEPTAGAADTAPWASVPWSTFRDTAPPAQQWLIEGLLPAGVLAFIAGPPKRGKTWVGIGLALAITLGQPLTDNYPTPRPCDVLYIALEGSATGLRTRFGALARGFGSDPDTDDLDRLHMLYRPRPFDLAELATADWLLQEALDTSAAIVFIDVLRAAARFDENAAADFGRLRDHLEPLLHAGITVILLHHFGKMNDTQRERSPGERMAGTGAMYGALDVGLLITKSEDGARRLGVEVEARDFAAPGALGLAIIGDGGGRHGGFRYDDTATLIDDETAAGHEDFVALVVDLLADEQWRSGDELADELDKGRRTIESAIDADTKRRKRDGTPARVVRWNRDGRELPPRQNDKPWAWNARPWGTLEMLQKGSVGSEPSQPSLLGELGQKARSPLTEGDRGTEPFETPSSGATEP